MKSIKPLLIVIAASLLFPTVTFADDNLLATAARNGSFKTLVSLVVAADLEEALQSKGSFTVFAPTDEAFEQLPKGTLESLLRPENREQLVAVLKYHVLPKEISVPKRNSHPIKTATTLLGPKVNFDRNGSEVKINNANIVTRNIRCSNGLIHVIDNVLLPPKDDKTIVGVASKAGGFETLLAAVKAAGLAEALAGDGPLTVFAPTDKAFKALPKGTLESLLKPENKEQLATILKYHVVSGKVDAKAAINAGQASTLAGQSVAISIRDGKLTINDATVLKNDLEASNGILHVIDKVLLPKTDSSKHESTSKSEIGNTSDEDQRQQEITITSDWDSPVNRDGIVADRINIKVGGAGRVKLTNVKAREVITNIGGGGSVTISGTVENHEVRVSGGAVLRARDLVTESTRVNVYGGGVAEVNATDALDASANAGAKVSYVATNARIKKSINPYATFVKLSESDKNH